MDRPEVHFEQANARMHAGDFEGAAAGYAQACRLRPGWVAALVNRGAALQRLGRPGEAELAFREALAVEPDSELVMTNLAGVLQARGGHEEAARLALRACAIAPDRSEPLVVLGDALHSLGHLVEAEASYRQAIALAPDCMLAHYNLGHVLNDQWRAAEAMAEFRRAIELDPGYQPARHALLFNLLYDPAQSEESIFAEHRRWGEAFAAIGQDRRTLGQRHAARRIRVGYVSPDFRLHSCLYFLRPLFAAHDRSVVEVFAYSVTRRPDSGTAWFRANAEHWRDVGGLDDAAIAGLVHDDGIDILVDLAGHTRDQPLGVFALRPAPIQVAWLGYPATTGLPQIGYRLTDALADPPGAADRCHTETLLRLPGSFLCYAPPDDAPGVAPAPRGPGATFGSFNNIAKITPEVIRTWAEILRRAPGSRLVIKSRILAHEVTRARFAACFADAGIEPSRLELRAWLPAAASPLAAYHDIDVALDTFPYNGVTTTFEALWMGVPVITLAGSRHAGRVGVSILSHLGHRDWVAEDRESYVTSALRLAADRQRLATLRSGLRAELVRSGLTDGRAFARGVEATYRELVKGTASGAP
jgi:predicted O-linked N-acetylglucosamine transferase (SPINDLY family)